MAINSNDLQQILTGQSPALAMTVNEPVVTPLNLKDLKSKLETLGVLPAGKGGTPDYKVNADALKNVDRAEMKEIQKALSKAGLYVPKGHKYYADGFSGASTEFAINLAADPDYAKKFLGEVALGDKDYMKDKDKAMQVQAALTSLGYNVGKVDGAVGAKTTAGLQSFLKNNPDYAKNVSEAVQDKLDKHSNVPSLSSAFKEAMMPDIPKNEKTEVKIERDGKFSHRGTDGSNLYSPEMLLDLERNPDKRAYLEMTLAAAKKHGLDEAMFANQIFKESQFKPGVKGPMTKYGQALGIAQVLPDTARDYGFKAKDLLDARKGLDAGAQIMADLTKKLGSQELATAAYNGGGVIDYVKRRVNSQDVNADDFIDVMEADIKKHGKGDISKWRNQTYHYVKDIVSDYWNDKRLAQAHQFEENKEKLSVEPEKPLKKIEPNSVVFAANDTQPNQTAFGIQDKGFLSQGFKDALAATDKPLGTPTLEDRNQAVISSFLKQDFLKAQLQDTPGDIKVAMDNKEKGPTLTSQAPVLSPVL